MGALRDLRIRYTNRARMALRKRTGLLVTWQAIKACLTHKVWA